MIYIAEWWLGAIAPHILLIRIIELDELDAYGVTLKNLKTICMKVI